MQNVAVSLITPIVAKHTNCSYKRSKKSLLEFVASKTDFKNFNTNRSRATNNLKASTTVKKQPNFKHFQSLSSKQSSGQEDWENILNCFVIEQHNLNKQMTKYTSHKNHCQFNFTCWAKTRPSGFIPEN